MKKVRVAVTGGRDFTDKFLVYKALNEEWYNCNEDGSRLFLVLGDCPTGVDRFARDWADFIIGKDSYRVFKADWDKFGKAAGPLRNSEMVKACDILLAFSGGAGTADCVRKALAARKAVIDGASGEFIGRIV